MMKNLIDLIASWWRKTQEASKEIAKERLKLVLVHDRASVSPQLVERMKEDMIRVISDYMEICEDEIEIQLSRTDGSVSLTANIPVGKMKRDISC